MSTSPSWPAAPETLDVRSDDSVIDDNGQTLTVGHTQLGGWVEALHGLAVDLMNRPQHWHGG